MSGPQLLTIVLAGHAGLALASAFAPRWLAHPVGGTVVSWGLLGTFLFIVLIMVGITIHTRPFDKRAGNGKPSKNNETAP